jgi:hypothetical protein
MKKYKKEFDEGTYVGVIISNFYGCGWSSYSGRAQEKMFDYDVVDMLTRGVDHETIDQFISDKYNIESYTDSNDLIVVWVKEGREFYIDEYDGHESVVYKDVMKWVTA